MSVLRALLLAALLAVGLISGPAEAAKQSFGDAEKFAQVPYPGHPESIIANNNYLYVGTTTNQPGTNPGPSHIFVYHR